MALISFLAGENFTITDLAGSGLGFYGPGGFGTSVRVGNYQDNTYITDATGAIQGPKVDNVQYVHPNSGTIAGGTTLHLRDTPNYLATLNLRFTHTAAVKVQNASVRIFDRSNIDAPASGVTVKVAELVHPWTASLPTGPLGSGSVTWQTLGGSGGLIGGRTYDPPLAISNSPGLNGLSPSGASTLDTQHDWFLAISASPDSIGSKNLCGLFATLEYL